MKRLLIYFLLIVNVFYADSKIDDLLKSDSQKYTTAESNKDLVKKSGKVEKIVGQAFLQKDGTKSWVQLVKNSKIEENVTIVTMADSEIKLKLDNDITVNLGAKSKIHIDNLKSKPKSEAVTEAGLKLLFGKVYSTINKKLETGAKYEIKSGSVVAGVRGTKFLVTNLKGGKVEIKVNEGFVVVTNTVENKEYVIQLNQKITIDEKGVTGKIEEFSPDDYNSDFNEEGVENEISELKELINQQFNVETVEYKAIQDIVNEGVWELQKEEGNKVIITIE